MTLIPYLIVTIVVPNRMDPIHKHKTTRSLIQANILLDIL